MSSKIMKQSVFSSTSQKTGLAPVSTMAHALAINELVGQITSSPKPIPSDFIIIFKPSDPLPTEIAWLTPQNAANFFSKRSTFSPDI